MSVLLVWSLDTMQPPCIITPETGVIDLTGADHQTWQGYISLENRTRVISEVHRWKTAVEAGANARQAYGYAIDGGGQNYWSWRLNNRDSVLD